MGAINSFKEDFDTKMESELTEIKMAKQTLKIVVDVSFRPNCKYLRQNTRYNP